MKTSKMIVALVLILLCMTISMTFAQKEKTVNVGGTPMHQATIIVENAVNSKDYITLLAALKAAGLLETLQSKEPFRVFAPTNAAFNKLLIPFVFRKYCKENDDFFIYSN